jgi:hypothetical protein
MDGERQAAAGMKMDIEETYLNSFLLNLPDWMAKDKGTVVRCIAEANAKALADVFAKIWGPEKQEVIFGDPRRDSREICQDGESGR